MEIIMDWRKQRDLILQWWPVYLTDPPQGHVFLEGLEQNLWTCENEKDFEQVLRHIQTIWGDNDLGHMSYAHFLSQEERQATPPLYSHFGASLGALLHQRLMGQDTGDLSWVMPQKHHSQDDNVSLAKKLQDQFGLASVNCSQSSDPLWLKRQLTDCHIGLTTLTELFNLPKESFGRGRLGLWFHQHAPFRRSMEAYNQMDILLGGGDVAHTWCRWVFLGLLQEEGAGRFDMVETSHYWRNTWGKSLRHQLERQQHFLLMSQARFKQLMDTVDVTTDLNQKALRRFKAYKKWTDDIERGLSLEALSQSWTKIKTGNKIAWSAEKEHLHFVQAWKRIEKSIERAFFTQANWNIPAWVQTSVASYATNEYSSNNEKQDCLLWSLGFEALVREQLGFDSWLSSSKSTHPLLNEAEDFYSFFHRHLSRYLF